MIAAAIAAVVTIGPVAGESVTATFNIKDDGTTMTVVRDCVEGEEYEDGDGEEDPKDELYWESYEYNVTGDALMLTADYAESFEYAKYVANK